MAYENNTSSLYITGLAHAYPSHSYSPEEFHELIERLYPNHTSSLGLQKLIQFNKRTQIRSRPTIFDFKQLNEDDSTPPTIDQLSHIFRTVGVDLAALACSRAIQESHIATSDITHVVAVTCTDQGNPGYDLILCQKLQLKPTVQRVLLHGVGCAGGLSVLRSAASIATAESQKGRPARILVIACELCSLFCRAELQAATKDEALHIAPVLFSDAAAALVLSNGLAMEKQQVPIFELQEWGSKAVPGTENHMSYLAETNGMIATISKDVSTAAVGAILPMFNELNASVYPKNRPGFSYGLSAPSAFDWAIHPGGAAILRGAKNALDITDDHIRASLEVYHGQGNSSSATVLIVLNELRAMGAGRDHIIATSFGPGMMIEMCFMKRCHDVEGPHPLSKS
ncbi:thiolase-like protein [Phaeosphaeriaceae sp. PMI808]|nr:thiolase-like protein [Phaeosphaeriaceae sp. PMI808]